MKHHFILLWFLLFCCSCGVFAQQSGASKEFESLRQQLLNEFDNFRKEANDEYADFLSKTWTEYHFSPGKAEDPTPKPVYPHSYQEEPATNRELQVEPEQVQEEPKAIEPRTEASIKEQLQHYDRLKGTPFQLNFYGADLQLHYSPETFGLPSIQEKATAALWKAFSKSTFTPLLTDLVDYKEQMQMNDGAYYMLIEKIANRISALKDENQRIIFQCFLLVQSGYDARIARVDDFLVLLLPIREEVYRRPYLQVDKRPYYLFSKKELTSYSNLFTYQLPDSPNRGNSLSLHFKEELLLPVQPRPFCIKAAGLEVKGEGNLNKIDFYRDYPSCELSIYARTMPGKELHKLLVHSLSEQLTGKSPLQALNLLLSWVQSGFRYQTDKEQFGQEKPFFIDETFYYPYCDCEDRAILFAYLVKNVLKRKVILLDYPGHVSTAVDIEANVKGTYILTNQVKYLICDPTFIGASAGNCMPAFKSKTPKLVK